MDGRATQHQPDESLTSLIFPTYNPGPRLEATLREVEAFLRRAPGRWEALFVCDGCGDGTTERLAESSLVDGERVRLVSYTPNRGKGHAVRRGLAEARGAYRIFTDVDLSYGLDGVLRVAERLWAGADVVTGSRLHQDSLLLVPSWLRGYVSRRQLQSVVFSTLVRWLLPLRQEDTQAGLKGFSASAAELLLPELRCDGFAFDCELLMACRHFGLEAVEVPVNFRFWGPETTTNFRATLRMIAEVWKIRREWIRKPAFVGATLAAPSSRAAA